jgi:cobyrinic acid a,c-diamide synthase
MFVGIPRLVIAGLSGDSGKTIISLSIIAALRQRGLAVSVFKKGPDYIDSAWLKTAADRTCRNLDSYLVDAGDLLRRFAAGAADSDIALIEGNRGIFDGKDALGTHSTAELARLLQAPLILVIKTTKATRTLAALIKGCLTFEKDLNFAGIVLNNVAGDRHREIISESVKKCCTVPIVGSLPQLRESEGHIPGRHLGLVPPSEFGAGTGLAGKLASIANDYIDLDAIMSAARAAGPLEVELQEEEDRAPAKVTIGFFRDDVFTFYYPENLEALEKAGANLIGISSTADKQLPEIDALYIGGGFPETQAERLAENKLMAQSVRSAAVEGMPIYAECGGLIYLSNGITWNDKYYPMAGVLPIDLKMNQKPVGHGYTLLRVDRPNPFFKVGEMIKGHEFHYSSILPVRKELPSCMAVRSGYGIGDARDGIVFKNTLACYTHIHADGIKTWPQAMIRNALAYQGSRRITGVRQAGSGRGGNIDAA